MTTAIALETSKGDLPLALALGAILITIMLFVNALAYIAQGSRRAALRMSRAMPNTAALLPLQLVDIVYEAGGKRLIDGVTLTLDAGPRTIIVGPNGAGKSVLLRLCHGLLAPTSGQVLFNGPDAIDGRRRQAMVFQRPVMLRRSALANVAYALALAGVSRDQQRRAAAEALDRVGLTHLAAQSARLLSGGEQQRLALARAWALRPELLLLDEPTANLDPSATQIIESVIQAMHDAGTKIVLVTHNLGQVHRLGDEVVFMADGAVAERAPVASFFNPPPRHKAKPSSRVNCHGNDATSAARDHTGRHIPRRSTAANPCRRYRHGALHHRCIDNLYRELGVVWLSAADLQAEDRHRVSCRRARHRASAGCGQTRRCGRGVRP